MEAAAMPVPPPSSPPLTAVPLSSRRVQTELTFRFPDEINFLLDVESPNNNNAASVDEDDDLLASYLGLEKIEGSENYPERNHSMVNDYDDCHNHIKDNHNNDNFIKLRHSRSAHAFFGSLDNSNNLHHDDNDSNKQNRDVNGEARKAMSPDKLAELWTVDPKRAKRILANRQSAARSKERKARYMVELEKKVQSLQTQATTLSVQLSLFERDTNSLSRENTELRRELESMEQQAQLRDALNDALKQEVDRLKIATGETTSPTDAFIVPPQNIPYSQLHPYESHMLNPNNNMDSNRSEVSHCHSFELNMSCPPQALDSTKTKMSHLSLLDLKVPSSHQPKLESQPPYPFEANMLSLDTSLYLPLDSSSNKPRMTQFHSIETNRHCFFPQPSNSMLGHLSQYPFESNNLSGQQEVYVTPQSHMFAQITRGFDIGGRGSHVMKVEGPSIVASDNMGGF